MIARPCDVVVVGGGPAGSVTALLLAQAGFAVTLLERQPFPRAKPCGDCLSPAANRILQHVGVWDDVLRARPALLQGWQLRAPDGTTFGARFDELAHLRVTGGIALSRDVLDTILLEHARRTGVQILTDAIVTDVTRRADGAVLGVHARRPTGLISIAAKLTIGADGLRSVVARRLHAHRRRPRLRKASFTMHQPIESHSSCGEMRLANHACLGIAPVQPGTGVRTHNITLVLKRGSFNAHAGARAIVRSGLRSFGLEPPPDDVEILTSGPFDWPVRNVTFDGAALVGDAAGYYDPFTGEGIYHALAGAQLLADHAARALHNGRVDRAALQPYHVAHRRLTAPARRLQRLVEFVCARPRLADRVFARIAARPDIARTLIGVTGDLLPPASLFSPRLLMRFVT
jgi:flavin-dependent dehydrogenase